MYCGMILATGDVRFQSGGYNPLANKAALLIGVCGMVLAYVGFDGVVERQHAKVQLFNRYQWLKLLISVVVFVMDMVALMSCDTWGSRLASVRAYNPTMDSISKKGVCSITRMCYAFGFLIDFSVNYYFTMEISVYASQLAQSPGYEIRFNGGGADSNDQ